MSKKIYPLASLPYQKLVIHKSYTIKNKSFIYKDNNCMRNTMNTADFTIVDWTNFYRFLFEHVIDLMLLLIKLLITIFLLDGCEFFCVALDLFVFFLSNTIFLRRVWVTQVIGDNTSYNKVISLNLSIFLPLNQNSLNNKPRLAFHLQKHYYKLIILNWN